MYDSRALGLSRPELKILHLLSTIHDQSLAGRDFKKLAGIGSEVLYSALLRLERRGMLMSSLLHRQGIEGDRSRGKLYHITDLGLDTAHAYTQQQAREQKPK